MIAKSLLDAIRQAEAWPVEDQEELAMAAREIAARRSGVYALGDDERAAVRAGLEDADRNLFASDEEVAAAERRHRS